MVVTKLVQQDVQQLVRSDRGVVEVALILVVTGEETGKKRGQVQ